MLPLTLNGASLTWRDLAAALTAERLGITMDPVARNQMQRTREAGLAALKAESAAAGLRLEPGFGAFQGPAAEAG